MRKLIVIFSLMFLCFSASNTYAQKKLTDKEIFARGHIFKPEQVVVADREYQYGTGQMIYKIERKKKETLVTFLQPIYFDSQWILYTKGYTIIDKKPETNIRRSVLPMRQFRSTESGSFVAIIVKCFTLH